MHVHGSVTTIIWLTFLPSTHFLPPSSRSSLGARSSSSSILFTFLRLLLSFGSRVSSGFGLLLFLRWGIELQRLLGIHRLAPCFLHRWLIDDGLKVAHDIRKLRTESSIEGHEDGREDDGGEGNICKGNPLTDEEGTSREISLNSLKGAQLTFSKGVVNLWQT